MNTFVLILALMMPGGQVQPYLTLSAPMSRSDCELTRDHETVKVSYLSEDYWQEYGGSGQPLLVCQPYGAEYGKTYEMRVTGYYAPPGAKGALAEVVRPGAHAAVSPGCIGLLGERVYVSGHGVFTVTDLAAGWLDTEHGMCTLDIASPSTKAAMAIGNETTTVVRLK